MIILNGKKFARNEKEFTDSLFSLGGTCVGYYKPLKARIKLFNMQKKLIGTITKYGVLALATPLEECTKDISDKGKYWYSFGDIEAIGSYDKYSDQFNEVQKALKDNNIEYVCSL